MVVYMRSILLQLAPGSRSLSQTEKRISVICKAEQIQSDNLLHPEQFIVSFCEFAQLSIKLHLFYFHRLEINHMIQEPTEAN